MVTAPTRELVQQIGRLLPAYRTTPDREPDDLIVIHHGGDGWSIEAEEAPPERFHSESPLLATVEYLVAMRLLTLIPDLMHLHAAGADVGGAAVLAVGDSGAGKSSLALEWCVAGYGVLGDDIVLLDDHHTVTAFKRHFRFRRDRLDALRIAPDPALDPLADRDEVRFDPSTVGRWGDAAPAKVVALVRHVPHAATTIEPVARAAALQHLLGALSSTGRPPAQALDRMIELLTRIGVVRVVFGDAADAARRIAALA